MRRITTLAAGLMFVAFAGAVQAQAQSDSLVVSAQNVGILELTFSGATFDFGTVDTDGTTATAGVTGARNGADDGALYTAASAVTWEVRSAPTRTVRLYNASVFSSIAWGTANRLRLEVPEGTSCGAINFGSTGDAGSNTCSNGVLTHSISAGNGANSATGSLNLELDVLDTDDTGTNSWTVVVTTVGS